MIKISVIIPVYNAQNYLIECIESVLNQTIQDIEIICINDGSNDDSLKILNDFSQKDNRIIVIDNTNHGVSFSRNCGIDIATGEYIAFLDSDDWVHPEMYESMYNTILESQSDLVVCSLCQTFKNDTVNRYITDANINLLQHDFLRLPINFDIIATCVNKLYKSNILKSTIRFNCSISMGEDIVFNRIYFSKCENIYLMKNIYYFVRQRNSSACSKSIDIDSVDMIYNTISEISKTNCFYDNITLQMQIVSSELLRNLMFAICQQRTYEIFKYFASYPLCTNSLSYPPAATSFFGRIRHKILIYLIRYKFYFLAYCLCSTTPPLIPLRIKFD